MLAMRLQVHCACHPPPWLFGTKARACGTRRCHLALAGSVPGGFRVRLGVWLGGEEEGKEDGLRMVRS